MNNKIFYFKFIFLLGILIFGGVFFAQNIDEIESGAKNVLRMANITTVCDETLYYSWGEIDPQFGLSQAEITVIVKEAEQVWENELGKNVFEYKDGAEFKINFIYDDRQERTNEKSDLDDSLEKLEYDKSNLSEDYQEKYSAYQKLTSTYEKNLKEYEDAVEDFNDEVAKWNKRGGVSEDKYDDLKDEEEELKDMRADLEDERDEINDLAEEINKLVKKENNLVENYNGQVQDYREKFGEGEEFNQGEYIGSAINIYEFQNRNDLTMVLAHELGHALGVGHVENSKSVMYYLMQDQDLENIKLSQEDLAAIKEICKIKE